MKKFVTILVAPVMAFLAFTLYILLGLKGNALGGWTVVYMALNAYAVMGYSAYARRRAGRADDSMLLAFAMFLVDVAAASYFSLDINVLQLICVTFLTAYFGAWMFLPDEVGLLDDRGVCLICMLCAATLGGTLIAGEISYGLMIGTVAFLALSVLVAFAHSLHKAPKSRKWRCADE